MIKRLRIKTLIFLWVLFFNYAYAYAYAYDRIISIGGGLTETIFALGAQDKLIARDRTSYYPKAVENLPDVGVMRMLSAEPIIAMNPDLILAKEGSGPANVLEQIATLDIKLEIMPSPHNIEELFAQNVKLGELLGHQEEAMELNRKLKIENEILVEKRSKLIKRPRVVAMLSTSPGNYRVAGGDTAIQKMVDLTGAENIFFEQNSYKNINVENMLQANPDYIFITQINEKNMVTAKQKFLNTPVLGEHFSEEQILMYDPLILLNVGLRSIATAQDIVDIYLNHQQMGRYQRAK